LSLLFQLGAVGLGLWLFLYGSALRRCLAAGPRGRLGAALLVAVLATNAISNDFLGRATLQWFVWAAVGAALAQPSSGSDSVKTSTVVR
jgi:hypothetical protein